MNEVDLALARLDEARTCPPEILRLPRLKTPVSAKRIGLALSSIFALLLLGYLVLTHPSRVVRSYMNDMIRKGETQVTDHKILSTSGQEVTVDLIHRYPGGRENHTTAVFVVEGTGNVSDVD